MLLYYKIKNLKTFNKEIEVDLIADMHIKKFISNTIQTNDRNVLKAIGVYGPNNTGKSCLIEAIYALKVIMLNEPHLPFYNSFYNDTVTEIEAIYEVNNQIYKYIVKYDSLNKKYLYEKLDRLSTGKSNNFTSLNLLLRSDEKKDIKIKSMKNIPVNLLNDNIPFFMLFSLNNTELEEDRNNYIKFAKSISFVNASGLLDISKTIDILQNDEKGKKFITSFAKNCDLNIEDFGYSNDINSDINISNELSKYQSNKEFLKVWSKHHGYVVPSVFFDSLGTRKLIALAGYIYKSLIDGGILLIDEIDSSLHHVIIRAIISLFNNELNQKTQLIFSTHDALTMDLRRLFRKDQIYLTNINEEKENELIHFSSKFTSRDENGSRGNEEVFDYYLKGRFGSIPSPDLFDTMYEVLKDE